MKKKLQNLFIIAGCNGAGKTTASFTVLPKLLEVKEFINADEIARGLSPFQPEKVSIEAGKIMLSRMQELLYKKEDFAFETTLASRRLIRFISQAKEQGYSVYLIFYWLDSSDLAIERVKARVSEGGHDIPTDTIIRRYHSGLKNFLTLYMERVDYWMLIDNSGTNPELIAEGQWSELHEIQNQDKWNRIKKSIIK